jgi:hypothetical protein
MKLITLRTRPVVAALAWLAAFSSLAFPPAPHHLLFGLVRDEYGNPLNGDNVELMLETDSGIQARTHVAQLLEPGVNYRLAVPMDAGTTSDLYKPNAVRSTVPFKIKVKVGAMTYLPIEMVADYSRLGRPGDRTLLNLTLGEDSDGDGLPDAWERALIAQSGKTQSLKDIRPEDDLDGDGLSNAKEYVSGNYAFDSKDGLSLKAIGAAQGVTTLEFMALSGRTYTIYSSSDFQKWSATPFRIPAEGTSASSHSNYQSRDVRILQVEVGGESPGQVTQFYKLMVQ